MNIDTILDKEIKDNDIKAILDSKGINEKTNKAAIINTLVDAAIFEKDTRAAMFLLEKATMEKKDITKNTPLAKARKQRK